MQENDPHEVMQLQGRAAALPILFQICPKKIFTILLILGVYANCAYATMLTVSPDGRMDYTHIQAAIYSASDQDTILVYPGRYTENIDYLGKSISLISLEALTGDSLYIASTIIDGGKNGSCVKIADHADHATLRGFTICNGTGEEVVPRMDKFGGGILVFQVQQVSLINCIVKDNSAGSGGGILCYEAVNLYFSGMKVFNNYACALGGGLKVWGVYHLYPTVTFDPVNRCSVYANYGSNPVDIVFEDLECNVDVYLDMGTLNPTTDFYINRYCGTPLFYGYTETVSILRAYRTEINHDLYVSPSGSDGNTGLSPSQALKSITRAMHLIAQDSLNIKTVHVAPGIYREAPGDQILPIPLKANVNLIGAGSEQTEIVVSGDLMDLPATVIIGGFSTNVRLKGFSIKSEAPEFNEPLIFRDGCKNLHISDIKISDMKAINYGTLFVSEFEASSIDSLVMENIAVTECLVFFESIISGELTNCTFNNIVSSFTDPYTPGDDTWSWPVIDINITGYFNMENCTFQNISVQNNQFTFITRYHQYNSDAIADIRVNNCLFANIRTNWYGGLYFSNNHLGNFTVSNCTFYDNYGSFGAVAINGKVSLRNNIFCNPDASDELFVFPPHPDDEGLGISDCDYNNIPGGLSSVLYAPATGNFIWGENNISQDPGFISTDQQSQGFLRLHTGSLCINAGTPDTTGLNLPPYDMAGNQRIWNGRIDMGCFEFGSLPWVGICDPELPPINDVSISLYPNPFCEFTNIVTTLPEFSKTRTASINVYNLRGQKLASFPLDPHKHDAQLLQWNGKDSHGKSCASGVYVISLIEDGSRKLNRKVTLIKD